MSGWEERRGALPAIDLGTLTAGAALQRRVDRKYVVTVDQWLRALAHLDAEPEVLEIDGLREMRYQSVYADTGDLACYYAAARRRPRRFKVRLREYVDSGTAALELKERSARGETVKRRVWVDCTGEDVWRARSLFPCGHEALDFLAGVDIVRPHLAGLIPVLATRYARTTLRVPHGRVTVDAHVTADDHRASITLGDALVVETKSVGSPGAVDRALWSEGVRPTALSKFGTSIAALDASLPANRWHRTLRRHLPHHRPSLATPLSARAA